MGRKTAGQPKERHSAQRARLSPSKPATAKPKRNVGRPRDYDPNLHPWLAETLAAAGLTDEEIAARLRKAASTFNAWKKFPEFSEALRRGKMSPNEQVKRSLFQRAIGYSYPSEEIFCAFGKVTRVPTTKHVPPDVTACQFWLVNRSTSDEPWKHIAHVDHTSGGKPIGTPVDLSRCTPEQLAVLATLAEKSEPKGSA